MTLTRDNEGWPVPRFCHTHKPERMSCETFTAMRQVEPSLHFNGMPYENYKALMEIDGRKRWVVLNRQFHCGCMTVYVARIVIVL